MKTPRRLRDSSKTRVKPVLDVISTERDWLPRLLRLPKGAGSLPQGLDLTVLRTQWGDPEPSSPASPRLLRWLVRNLGVAPKTSDQRASADHRRRLIQRDADTIRQALAELEKDSSRGNWWVLEGPTYPDAVVETPAAIIVIEGKRTERKPTIDTTWMRIRHQMLRHMDGAWEQRRDRRVLGFFIVEETESGLLPGWRSAAKDTVSPAALVGSLPHRTEAERSAIAEGFLGITSWQTVCREFAIDPSDLPETVADLPRWRARYGAGHAG